MKISVPNRVRSYTRLLRACSVATGRALRPVLRSASRAVGSLGVAGVALTLPLLADTTVPPTTVSSGQTLSVQDAGIVTTSGAVNVQSGGTAILQGGTAVRLTPGFRAFTGSAFRAFVEAVDQNLGGFVDLVDSDFDGLPDAWEALHWGSGGNLTTLTGTGDNDGDGVLNKAEYLAGSNPMVNENTATLPSDTQVVVRLPTGSYNKVKTDWSILAAP